MARAADHHRPGTQGHRRDPAASAGSRRRNGNLGACQLRPSRRRGKQRRSAVQRAIPRGPHDQVDRCRPPREARIDVAFTVGHDHHRSRLGQMRPGLRRTVQPADAFLVLQGARPRGRGDEVVRAGPDPRVQQTQHSLRLAVDGDHRMNEEPGRHAVARRSQAAATLLAAGEADLRRVLRRHDPPSRAGRRRAGRKRCHHLAARHRGRRQKPVDRDLPRTVTAELADHQRSGLHHPLNQPGSGSRATDIAKTTQRAFSNDQHIPPNPHRPEGVKAWSPPQVNCVNAVGTMAGILYPALAPDTTEKLYLSHALIRRAGLSGTLDLLVGERKECQSPTGMHALIARPKFLKTRISTAVPTLVNYRVSL